VVGSHEQASTVAERHPETEAAHRWAEGFRRRRDELRRALGDGSTSLAEVLARADDGDDGRVTLLFVLESLPGAGKVTTRRRLAELGLPEQAPLRSLSAEQRRQVLDAFAPVGDEQRGRAS
jgi:hypothetical protein